MAAAHEEAAAWSEEVARRVWGGAVPLQVHLHDADVTALPPPPPPGRLEGGGGREEGPAAWRRPRGGREPGRLEGGGDRE